VPFKVFTHKKHMQKLDDMHNKPVSARMVASAEQWPWSSFRLYYRSDSCVLAMDRIASRP